MLQTCEVGGAVTSLAMYGHGHARTFTVTHSRILTAMVTHAHGHGHAHTFTAMAGTPSTRPAGPVHADQAPTNPLKCPEAASHLRRSAHPTRLLKYPGGHGHGIASRCGADVAVGPAFKPALAAQSVGSPRNLDRLDSTKVRRCGVRAIGSAGRMTDHAGQTRRHAGAWVRSLHFSTLSRIS